MKLEAEILLDRGVDQQRPVEPVRRRGADLPLDPGLVEQLEHREVGGAARVERALGLDRLAAVEHQRVLAHRDDAGAEPVLVGPQRLDHGAVERRGREAADRALEVPGEARESEIEAGPAQAGDGGEQGLLGAVDLVGEQGMEAVAAEALLLLDDQQRHFGALARQRQGGERAGDAAARDHHPCRLPRAIRRP